MEAKDSINQDIIKIKTAQSNELKQIIELRSNQLVAANTELIEKDKLIKRQKFKILAYKIALIGSAMAYFLLSI